MRHTTLAAALLLSSIPTMTRAQASADRAALPLEFAQASEHVRQQFSDDWHRLSGSGKEWAYCVTKWSVGETQDKDTVYVATEVERMGGDDAEAHSVYAGCLDPKTHAPLPMAHAHPSGDCSPSRADITLAVVRATAPFALIVCGPTSTVGYIGTMYRRLVMASQP